MTIAAPHITTVKNQYLLALIEAEAKRTHTEENYDFYYDKAGNQQLYEKYVKEGSPSYVNLPDKLRTPLDKLAAAKKWSSMSTGMKAARAEIGRVLNDNVLSKLAGTPNGQIALTIVMMGLDGSKAIQARPFFTVFDKPNRPQDKYDAYLAMVKLSSKSKVDAALAARGTPAPDKPMSEDAKAKANQEVLTAMRAKAAKRAETAKKFVKAINEAQSYYTSSLKFLKENGRPADPDERERMFESARLRHDRIHGPYVEVIRRDRAFTTDFKDVVVLMKKLDASYAEVRQKLG